MNSIIAQTSRLHALVQNGYASIYEQSANMPATSAIKIQSANDSQRCFKLRRELLYFMMIPSFISNASHSLQSHEKPNPEYVLIRVILQNIFKRMNRDFFIFCVCIRSSEHCKRSVLPILLHKVILVSRKQIFFYYTQIFVQIQQDSLTYSACLLQLLASCFVRKYSPD